MDINLYFYVRKKLDEKKLPHVKLGENVHFSAKGKEKNLVIDQSAWKNLYRLSKNQASPGTLRAQTSLNPSIP